MNAITAQFAVNLGPSFRTTICNTGFCPRCKTACVTCAITARRTCVSLGCPTKSAGFYLVIFPVAKFCICITNSQPKDYNKNTTENSQIFNKHYYNNLSFPHQIQTNYNSFISYDARYFCVINIHVTSIKYWNLKYCCYNRPDKIIRNYINDQEKDNI
jgi:hypothetical protein